MELAVSIISARQLGYTNPNECYPYGCIDWQGESHYTEVLSHTITPKWNKGMFRFPFEGSFRNQTITVSVFNCDSTGGGNDQFLGQSIVDLYAALPFDSLESLQTNKKDQIIGNQIRMYDDWVILEGGISSEATVRLQLALVPKSQPLISQNEIDQEELIDNDEISEPLWEKNEETLFGYEPDMSLLNNTESPEQDEQNIFLNEDINDNDNISDQSISYDRTDDDINEDVSYSLKDNTILSNGVQERTINANYLYPDTNDLTDQKKRLNSLSSSTDRIYTALGNLPEGLPETQPNTRDRRHTASAFNGVSCLKLKILEARDLIPRSSKIARHYGPFPNVYCLLDWHDGDVITTDAIDHSLNPIWDNEEFELPLIPSDFSEPIPIYLRDYDNENATDIGGLGVAYLDLCKLVPNTEITKVLHIQDGRGHLKIMCYMEGDEVAIKARSRQVKKHRKQLQERVVTLPNLEESPILSSVISDESLSDFPEPSIEQMSNQFDTHNEDDQEIEQPIHNDDDDSGWIDESSIGSSRNEWNHKNEPEIYQESNRPFIINKNKSLLAQQEDDDDSAESEADRLDEFLYPTKHVLEGLSKSTNKSNTSSSKNDSGLSPDYRRVQSKLRDTPSVARHRASIFSTSTLLAEQDVPSHRLSHVPKQFQNYPTIHVDDSNEPFDVYDNKEGGTSGSLASLTILSQRRPSSVTAAMIQHPRRFVSDEENRFFDDSPDELTKRTKIPGVLDDDLLHSKKQHIMNKRGFIDTEEAGINVKGEIDDIWDKEIYDDPLISYKNKGHRSVFPTRKIEERIAPLNNKWEEEGHILSSEISETESEIYHPNQITYHKAHSFSKKKKSMPYQSSKKLNHASNSLVSHGDTHDSSMSQNKDKAIKTQFSSFHPDIPLNDKELHASKTKENHFNNVKSQLSRLNKHDRVLAEKLQRIFPTTTEDDIIKAIHSNKHGVDFIESSSTPTPIEIDQALRTLVHNKLHLKGKSEKIRASQAKATYLTQQDPSRIPQQPLYPIHSLDTLQHQKIPVNHHTMIEPTGKKKGLIISCTYKDLGHDAIFDPHVLDNVDTTILTFSNGFGIPHTPNCLRVITPEMTLNTDANILPTKQDIYKGFSWLANDVKPGDLLYLYFSGYRTLLSDNPESVMVSDDGKEISKEDVILRLYGLLPAESRLTCFYDYYQRHYNDSERSDRAVEEDSLSFPYRYTPKQDIWVKRSTSSFIVPADIQTFTMKVSQSIKNDTDIPRAPLNLSLAAVIANTTDSYPLLHDTIHDMTNVTKLRDFQDCKPVVTSSQKIPLDSNYSFGTITPNSHRYMGRTIQGDIIDTSHMIHNPPSVSQHRSPESELMQYNKQNHDNDTSQFENKKKTLPSKQHKGQAFNMTGQVPLSSQRVSQRHVEHLCHKRTDTLSPSHSLSKSSEPSCDHSIPPSQTFQKTPIPHHHHVITKMIRTPGLPTGTLHHHHVVSTITQRGGNLRPRGNQYYNLPPPSSY